MTSLSRKLLLAFGALGLAAALTSSFVHYKLLTDPGYSSFCDISGAVNCTQAYLSPYGSLFGVPVALAGVFFFALVLLLAGLGGRGSSPAGDSVPAYVFALSTIGLAVVLYLGWASYVQLKVFCMLCAVTYVAVIALFIISGGASNVPMTTLPRRAPRDVRTLFSSPVALVLALLYIASAGSVVAFFPKETQVAHAAVEPLKPLDEKQRAELVNWWDLQPKTDVPLPADGSKVQVLIFSDYQCPHCRAAHEAYRSIFAKYAGNKAVHLELKHFPLEGECNSNAPQGSHLAACEAAAAVVLSRATGKAATMEDWLFENQATLTPSVVRQAASAIGGIADFNGEYANALNEVRADANLGGLLGVNSTPTLFVNGRKLPPGLIPANYVETLIELELQRAK